MRIILLLFTLCLSLSAAVPPTLRSEFYTRQATDAVLPLNDVTNLSGYPIRAFYMPSSSGYVTNSSIPTLIDWSTNAFNLTNRSSSANWPIRQLSVSGINGHDSLLFDGASDYLTSTIYTNGATEDIFMVFRYNDVTNGVNRFLINGKNAAGHRIQQSTAGVMIFSSTGSVSDGPMYTNKWLVVEVISSASGTGATIYTNNVSAVSGGTGQTRTQDGMTLAADNFLGNFGPLDLAMMVTYGHPDTTVPIPGTNTVARGRVFSSITNWFNISL